MESIQLNITGMTCDHCATGIEKLLLQNEGVKEATVIIKMGIANILLTLQKLVKKKLSIPLMALKITK